MNQIVSVSAQVDRFRVRHSDCQMSNLNKHSRKSTIFLCVTQIFLHKIAHFREDCAQKRMFVQEKLYLCNPYYNYKRQL